MVVATKCAERATKRTLISIGAYSRNFTESPGLNGHSAIPPSLVVRPSPTATTVPWLLRSLDAVCGFVEGRGGARKHEIVFKLTTGTWKEKILFTQQNFHSCYNPGTKVGRNYSSNAHTKDSILHKLASNTNCFLCTHQFPEKLLQIRGLYTSTTPKQRQKQVQTFAKDKQLQQDRQHG